MRKGVCAREREWKWSARKMMYVHSLQVNGVNGANVAICIPKEKNDFFICRRKDKVLNSVELQLDIIENKN